MRARNGRHEIEVTLIWLGGGNGQRRLIVTIGGPDPGNYPSLRFSRDLSIPGVPIQTDDSLDRHGVCSESSE